MPKRGEEEKSEVRVSASIEEMVLKALDREEKNLQTGRYIVTFRESAVEEGLKSLDARGFRVADARDFKNQAVTLRDVGDADALVFPEIGSAVVSGAVQQEFGMTAQGEMIAEGPIETIEPEYFVFANNNEYLRGFASAANAIAMDLGAMKEEVREKGQVGLQVLGATWGLVQCKVPSSPFSGLGIKVAVLDTGFDIGHPDFIDRSFTTETFVGQPVQDMHSHGTHTIGTACGPKEPSGDTPRYGIAYECQIFAGKVLSNAGSGSTASVLAGINWAIANGCEVISMSLGSSAPVQTAYTKAGSEALKKGCLIIAAAGNNWCSPTGAPANSPTIMSVASLDPTLTPSPFSNCGKIDIAAPGGDVFSSEPRPRLHGTKSGTSMATPHVAGCAALWAESSPTLRGMNLWQRLQSSALKLNFPPSKVGSGLVQAP
ncbi:S8 family serine peptidase [Methanosarcina sp. T3]|uniref:S8 family serine peptidase n=1 Tax=Methanosarcina sp. T3 TaxID=3439062 RepID=UPI003F86F75D